MHLHKNAETALSNVLLKMVNVANLTVVQSGAILGF